MGRKRRRFWWTMTTLRYRLMPYIYSEAWQVTSNHGTLMRPLVMDWRKDVDAQNTGDEYLFGPAMLVSPVYTQGATKRTVYLPKATWYDFWTGAKTEGGQAHRGGCAVERSCRCLCGRDRLCRWGRRWSGRPRSLPIRLEVRVYPGADGDFTFYEDENDGYNYTKGATCDDSIPLG